MRGLLRSAAGALAGLNGTGGGRQQTSRGQSEGEINAGVDARAVARYLLTALAGLKVMGVSKPAERDVREVVSLILRVLD